MYFKREVFGKSYIRVSKLGSNNEICQTDKKTFDDIEQDPKHFVYTHRVTTVRENILENKKKQVREKSGIFIFCQGSLEKNEKSHGKVREN